MGSGKNKPYDEELCISCSESEDEESIPNLIAVSETSMANEIGRQRNGSLIAVTPNSDCGPDLVFDESNQQRGEMAADHNELSTSVKQDVASDGLGTMTDTLKLLRTLGLDAGVEAEAERRLRAAAVTARQVLCGEVKPSELEEEGLPAAAVAALRRAADAEVQFLEGVRLERGYGVPPDEMAARGRYEAAAAGGHAGAEAALGDMYNAGAGGLSQDFVAAAQLYRRAAAAGVARAQSMLGVYHYNGHGDAALDLAEAVRLFRLAAAAGHPDAHCNLGRCYYLGEGGLPRDEEEAVRLFLLAAAHGDPVAQYNLGICAEHGHGGLPADPAEAERWYRLAADQGQEGAIADLERLRAGAESESPEDE